MQIGALLANDFSTYLRWYLVVSIVVEIIAFVEIVRIEREIRNGETFRKEN